MEEVTITHVELSCGEIRLWRTFWGPNTVVEPLGNIR